MGKALIIAEKPSVATDLARVLKAKKPAKTADYYENDQYVIASAVGHLIELAMPEDLDKGLRFWTLSKLPIIPEEFPLKVKKTAESKFKVLKELMKRKDVDLLINGCDAGREGELIFTYIVQYAKCKKPVKRLWMQSMTAGSIREAFNHLRDGEKMIPLQNAARSRSESDWLIGINGTRATTKRLYGRGQVATVGRVQTPTLTLVCDREKEIREFEPKPYWKLSGQFRIQSGLYEGILQVPNYKNDPNDKDGKADRFWKEEEVQAILQRLQQLTPPIANIEETARRSKSKAPMLYDLTSLQRDANSRYGYSATYTLQLAQALYEKHKMLTYPRTDSKNLPEDYLSTCLDTVSALQSTQLGPHAKKALANGYIRFDKRIFNNAKISDHFAIIPTGEYKASLSPQEQNIYNMVSARFLAAFFPPAEYDITTRFSHIESLTFKTEGKVLAVPGWLEVYGKSVAADPDSLPPLSPGDGQPPKAAVEGLEKLADTTKPPARFSEATLLTAMENAGKMVDDDELAEAMKGKGLGTPATRAQIIEHLCKENYLERQERQLVPTPKAETLIDFLYCTNSEFLTQAELTGEWEYKLDQIERGELDRETFMKGIRELTTEIIDHIRNWEDAGTPTAIISPSDNQPMMEQLKSYNSQDGKYVIYKTIANRAIKPEEVEALLTKGRTELIEDFVSKAGRPFSAFLVMNTEENKVEFEFPEREEDQASDEEKARVKSIIELLSGDIEWAPAEKVRGRVYDDSKFYESLRTQAERKMLSKAQMNALQKMILKYKDQIKDFESRAATLNLATEDPNKVLAQKLLKDLSTITKWEEPSGTGRRKKDDREFYESIAKQIDQGKSLSTRQVTALSKLHEKYCKSNQVVTEPADPTAPTPTVAPTTSTANAGENSEATPMLEALAKVTKWEAPSGTGRAKKDDQAFFESLKKQADRGKTLSVKQVAALKKLFEKYSD